MGEISKALAATSTYLLKMSDANLRAQQALQDALASDRAGWQKVRELVDERGTTRVELGEIAVLLDDLTGRFHADEVVGVGAGDVTKIFDKVEAIRERLI